MSNKNKGTKGQKDKRVLVRSNRVKQQENLRGGINELTLNALLLMPASSLEDDFFSRRPDEGP
nr:hypothetical protein BCU61_05730 [Vibrio splendidus]PMJ27231.1 hypothetical protein BCU26_19450 [Vibrio splendidus]